MPVIQVQWGLPPNLLPEYELRFPFLDRAVKNKHLIVPNECSHELLYHAFSGNGFLSLLQSNFSTY